MTPRWSAKADENQAEIVEALRRAGASVQTLHRLGQGVPDLLVGYQGRNLLMEIKGEKGKLTTEEERFFEDWSGQVAVVRSAEDALFYMFYCTGDNPGED